MKMKIILGIAVMFLFFIFLVGNASASIIYQENANATQCSGSWYGEIGYGCDKVYDADWNTFGLGIDPDNLGYYYANCTVPLNMTDAIWQTSTVNLTIEPFPTSIVFNGTVPQECLLEDVLQFRVISADVYGSYWACWNYTSSDWTSRSGGAFSDINSCGQSFECGIYGYVYEEGVFWNITESSTFTDMNIQSPDNITYATPNIWFNLTAGENADVCIVDYGLGNITMTNSSGNWNYVDAFVVQGVRTATFYCNSTTGIWNSSMVTFTVDSIPPNITILSPTNPTYYNTALIWFNITLDKNGNTCFVNYSSGNIPMTNSSGNWHYSTILSNGAYTPRFRCNDTVGNSNTANGSIFNVISPPKQPIIDPSSITGQLVFTLGFGIMGLFAVLTLLGFGYLETTGKPDPETIAKIMVAIVIIILAIVAVWTGVVHPP